MAGVSFSLVILWPCPGLYSSKIPSFLCCGVQQQIESSRHISPWLTVEEGSTLSFTLFLMQPRVLMAAFAARTDCRLVFNLVSTRAPRSLLPNCSSAHWPTACRGTRAYYSLSRKPDISPCWTDSHLTYSQLFLEGFKLWPSPEQPSLTPDLLWAVGWTTDLLRSLPTWVIVWFSDTFSNSGLQSVLPFMT